MTNAERDPDHVPTPAETATSSPWSLEPPVKTPGGPPSVRVGCAALALMALLMVGQAVSAVYDASTVAKTAARLAPQAGATAAEASKFAADQRSYDLLFAFVVLIIALFLALAVRNSVRGKRSGQVLSIAYSIPLLFCAAVPFMPGSQSALEIAYGDAEAGWEAWLDLATLAVTPLAIIVIIAMLTRSARRHFSWLPPAPPGYIWAPSALPWPYEPRR